MPPLQQIGFSDKLLEFINKFGPTQGLFVVFVLGLLFFLYRRFDKLYDRALDEKQKEIDRLTAENKSYREMFLSLLREGFKLNTPANPEK